MAHNPHVPSGHNRWMHRFAMLTAGATFVLIIAGGLVTSTGSGLAVPDWPTTFGYNMFLYPWSKMAGGILIEHGHRLIGAGVGLLTLVLALWLWVTEQRASLRWLGVAALVLVIVQGILGGLRVVWLDQSLAIVHAALAQAFFALIAGLTFLTSRDGSQGSRKIEGADAARVRALALVTTSVIYLQMILGAVLRHTGMGIGVHLACGAVVTIQVLWLAAVILKGYAHESRLVQPVALLSALLVLQLVLGAGAYLGKFTSLGVGLSFQHLVALTTTHVVVGALMLAVSLVLTLRVYLVVTAPVPPVGGKFIPSHSAAGSEA